jgi:hypothetical protein
MLFTVPPTGGLKRKPNSSLVLKILTKNPKEGKNPDKNSSVNSTKYDVQEFHLK